MKYKGLLSLIGLVILISFQNCGFSGFVTDLESSSSIVSDLSGSHGTPNLTTIPKGQLTHFAIPEQLVSMKLSVIDLSQNQILAYSNRFAKFISFDPDGKSFQDVTPPELQSMKIVSARAYSKFTSSGWAKFLYRNPASVVTVRDAQNKISHGLLMTENRAWVSLDFPSDCTSEVRGAATVGEHIAFCESTTVTKPYFQKVDDRGQKIGSVIQASGAFSFYGSRALAVNVVGDSNFTKIINTSTGQVRDIHETFGSLLNIYYVVYRSDTDSIVYLSSDYQSLIEKNVTTGQQRILLSSSASFSANGLNQNLFLIYNQDNGTKYLVSASATSAVTQLSDNVAGFAISSHQLALFIPDPTSSTIKINIQLRDVQSLAMNGLCSTAAPAAADFYGHLIGYTGFEKYFTNSIGGSASLKGMNMAFVMDRTCTDLYLPTIFRSSDGETYTRNLYKYKVATSQNQIIYTNTIPRDGMGYFGDAVAIDNGSLYFSLPNARELYVAGNGQSARIGTVSYQDYGEPFMTNWNHYIYRITYADSSTGYVLPMAGTGIAKFSLPRANATPLAKFLTNGGRNYVLLTKESSRDTSNSEAYSFQFYNENNSLIKKEMLNVNITGASLALLPQVDRSNPDSPFLGIKLSTQDGEKTISKFMIVNLLNQTVTVIEPAAGIEFSYDTAVTADGNLLDSKAFCLVSRKQCVSNPFNQDLEKTSGNLAFVVDGYYYFNFYGNGETTFKRYSYDGNLSFTLVKDFGAVYGNLSSDNRWFYSLNYTTFKLQLHNLVSGMAHEMPGLYEWVTPVTGGFIARSVDANQTYSHWYIDLSSLKAEKIDELSGIKEQYFLYQTGGKLVNSKTSNVVTMYGQTSFIFLNLTTKKVSKRVDMPYGSAALWEDGNQIIIGQNTAMGYLPAYSHYKYKLMLIDLKTGTEKEIDISKYSSFVCRIALGKSLYCLGRKGDAHSLVKYQPSAGEFEDIAEVNSERNFGGLVELSKDLTFISFSAINYQERYMMFPYSSGNIGQIGDGWEGYVYKQ